MSEKFLIFPTVLASTRDPNRPNESADFSFPTAAADEADGALVFQYGIDKDFPLPLLQQGYFFSWLALLLYFVWQIMAPHVSSFALKYDKLRQKSLYH